MTTTLERDTTTRAKLPDSKYANGGGTDGVGAGRFHWTVELFYRASDSGIFDEPKQWELIDGDLWRRDELNPPHAFTTRKIGRLMRRLFEPTFLVQEEKPIHLAENSEPMPDVCVVADRDDEYASRHPVSEEVRLLIEVADATGIKDTGEKADLYAQAGIADYWVVLVNRRQINVYRAPENGEYSSPRELRDGDTISPLAAPDVSIAVSDLLPPLE
ncbi:MAG: Uma2 family endonuclease [Akkermansiaceae bacterium]|nr:Uma2 family endonuclease [Armatimonadota bacterium]